MTDKPNRIESETDTDAAVMEFYRDTKDERAPEALNRAVLDQAAKAAQPRYSRVRSWTRPMAWAVTAMLSVAIVLQLTQAPAPNGIDFDDGSYELDTAAEIPADQPEESTDTARKSEALDATVKQVAPAALSEARQREQQSKATSVGQSRAKPEPAALAPTSTDQTRLEMRIDAFEFKDQDKLQRTGDMANMQEGEIQEAVAAEESTQAGAVSAESRRASSTPYDSDHCDETATATPEAWLQCIASLEEAGLADAAAEERELLAAAFPDFNVP